MLLYTATFLHTHPCVCKEACTQRNMYTNKKEAYPQKLFNTEAFPHRFFCTEKFSQKDVITRRSCYYTEKPLDTWLFKCRSWCAKRLYTQKLFRLAVRVRQRPLRSRACSCSPARNTLILSLLLRSMTALMSMTTVITMVVIIIWVCLRTRCPFLG